MDAEPGKPGPWETWIAKSLNVTSTLLLTLKKKMLLREINPALSKRKTYLRIKLNGKLISNWKCVKNLTGSAGFYNFLY